MKILKEKEVRMICDTLAIENQVLVGTDFKDQTEWARAVAEAMRTNTLIIGLLSRGKKGLPEG